MLLEKHCKIVNQTLHYSNEFNNFIVCHHKLLLYELKFSRWFYFREFRESNLAKISTSIYVYL